MPEVFYTADFGSALAVSILLATVIFGGEWVLKSYLKNYIGKKGEFVMVQTTLKLTV